ncbi:MAG: hypothetical protein AB2777_20655 [Candidatus Thiodiazotropha endolucinida]
MKCYFTFGQIHAHRINGKTLDKDCVAEMTAESLLEGHNKGMEIFNEQFHLSTAEPPDMSYYPRGIINID